MREYKAVVYDENLGEKGKLDLYLPEKENFPLLLWFHGGSLAKGGREEVAPLLPYLLENGIGVASASYPLYPDAKYPDFILAAAKAAAFCYRHLKEYGASKLFVSGSSAGAYLAMMLCFDPQYLGKYGIAPTDVSGYIHDAGQPTCHFNVLKERGLDKRRVIVDESAPIYHVGLAETYAPMLFIYSDDDMVNRKEQILLLLKTLSHFGYDPEKIESVEMHGKHCAYLKNTDYENPWSKTVSQFIKKFS